MNHDTEKENNECLETEKKTPSQNPRSEFYISVDNTTDSLKNSSWQKDIESRDYYYDDSHGYEVYNPDKDEEENDDN